MVPKRQTWTSEENGKDMPIKTKKSGKSKLRSFIEKQLEEENI